MTTDTILGLAVYRAEQWPLLLASAADREDLEETWEEWYEVFQKSKENLEFLGIRFVEVEVDMQELTRYCKVKGVPNDADTRSFFVTERLRQGKG